MESSESSDYGSEEAEDEMEENEEGSGAGSDYGSELSDGLDEQQRRNLEVLRQMKNESEDSEIDKVLD